MITKHYLTLTVILSLNLCGSYTVTPSGKASISGKSDCKVSSFFYFLLKCSKNFTTSLKYLWQFLLHLSVHYPKQIIFLHQKSSDDRVREKKYSWDANKFHFHSRVYRKMCVTYHATYLKDYSSLSSMVFFYTFFFFLFIVYSTKCWFMCEILFVNRWWNAASNKHLSYAYKLRNIFLRFFFFILFEWKIETNCGDILNPFVIDVI